MDNFEKIISVYIISITFCVGLIGNFLCILVFSRRRLSRISSNFFFKAVAVIDSFILLQEIRYFLLIQYDLDLKLKGIWSCRIFSYITYVLVPISAWSMVYISLDRYMSMKFGQIYRLRNEIDIKWIIFGSIIFINMIGFIPLLFYVTINYQEKICYFRDETQKTVITCFNVSFSVIIPFFLMVISTILIVRLMYRSKKNFITEIVRVQKDIRIAVVSTILNMIFLLFYLPVTIIDFFEFGTFTFMHTNLNNLVYINCAIKFFLHLITNKYFREEFIGLFSRFKSNAIYPLIEANTNSIRTENY